MRIRKAVINDVHSIHNILTHYAENNLMLPRSLSALYDHLRDYFVLEGDKQGQRIKGVCGLGICWEDLAEIRSLAVTEDQQGKGSGSRLVEKCLEEARGLGLKKVFVLTLFLLGGGVIHDFVFAILIGVIVGTYSSVFVASPVLLIWEGTFAKKAK